MIITKAMKFKMFSLILVFAVILAQFAGAFKPASAQTPTEQADSLLMAKQVTGVKVIDVGGQGSEGQVYVTWNPFSYDEITSMGVIGFKIYYMPTAALGTGQLTSNTPDASVTVAPTPDAYLKTISGFTPGEEYSFVVYATNGRVDSLVSSTASGKALNSIYQSMLKSTGISAAKTMESEKAPVNKSVLTEEVPKAQLSMFRLDPTTITKYVNPLPLPGAVQPIEPGGSNYEITMEEAYQDLGLRDPVTGQVLMTKVWGYNGSYPGPTIEAVRGKPINVKWINNLPPKHLFTVDPTLVHDAANVPEVRNVVHLHGGEVPPESDGYPHGWFSSDPNAPANGMGGPAGNSVTYTYPNEQPATTLWYHDHAMGVTRLNVMAGLAGFYLLRDPAVENSLNLPQGKYEVPMVIQDRSFNADGSIYYPSDGINPDIHPNWVPEFFGDTILVNGKVWPYFEVEPRKYRIRLLNGSNSRFYNLTIPLDETNTNLLPITQIGTDGGYLPAPVTMNKLLIAPGERTDLIIDFSNVQPGTNLIINNDANDPYPDGDPVDPQTTGQIMQFKVKSPDPNAPLDKPVPDNLVPVNKIDSAGANVRPMVLGEMEGPNGPLAATLNGKGYMDGLTEMPHNGSTEIWEFINTTPDTHPMHLHLVQFQILDRQDFNVDQYMAAHEAAGKISLPPDPYISGSPVSPEPNEIGWKDTIKVHPGQVTRVLVRFTQANSSSFSFDPTTGEYVWHCHILEHEENDMMRPMRLLAPDSVPPSVIKTDPLAGAKGFPVNRAITINFNEPVKQGANYTDITLKDAGGKVVAAAKSISDNVLKLTPTKILNYSAGYTVTIPTGAVKDMANNDLSGSYSFSFSTGIPALTLLPPLNPNVPADITAGSVLPINFSWVSDGKPVRDQSVSLRIRNAVTGALIVGYTYNANITIDEINGNYSQDFDTTRYNVLPGTKLKIMVYFGSKLQGTALVNVN